MFPIDGLLLAQLRRERLKPPQQLTAICGTFKERSNPADFLDNPRGPKVRKLSDELFLKFRR